MMHMLHGLFSGQDNETPDLGRWSWAGSFLAVVGALAANVYRGQIVDLQSLATALGLVAGAHGAALWAKASTEPKPK